MAAMEHSANQITVLLQNWSQGDEHAIDQLVPLVYDELRRMARRYISTEKPGHTLHATALVSEAYLRLMHGSPAEWQNRTQFYAVCAQVMRRILVGWARSRLAQRRGSDLSVLVLDEAIAIPAKTGTDLVAIDDALKALAQVDDRKCRVVELRFFGGLSISETAGF